VGRSGRARAGRGGARPGGEARRGPGRAGEAHGGEGRIKTDRYKPVLDWFAAGNRLELSDDADDKEYLAALSGVPGLAALADEFLPSRSPQCRAAAMELVLEGLHQHSLLAKEDLATGASYSDMLGIMLEGLK
jgi:magnesium chelatase subunit I